MPIKQVRKLSSEKLGKLFKVIQLDGYKAEIQVFFDQNNLALSKSSPTLKAKTVWLHSAGFEIDHVHVPYKQLIRILY